MIPSEIIKKVKQIRIVTRHTVNGVIAEQYHSVFKGQAEQNRYPEQTTKT